MKRGKDGLSKGIKGQDSAIPFEAQGDAQGRSPEFCFHAIEMGDDKQVQPLAV